MTGPRKQEKKYFSKFYLRLLKSSDVLFFTGGTELSMHIIKDHNPQTATNIKVNNYHNSDISQIIYHDFTKYEKIDKIIIITYPLKLHKY